MLKLLYDTSLFLMRQGFSLASLIHPKAKRWAQGQKQVWQQPLVSVDGRRTAWFHCASVGEFEQARPVLEAFREHYPEWRIVLTFFSPSGYELRKNYEQADVVSYLPADTAENARRFVGSVQPQLVFWVKYEFWYYHLMELKHRSIPVLLFSAIFRSDQSFFKPYGGFYRSILACFSHLFVQNQISVDLLSQIGIKAVTLGGDTRFDRVIEIAAQAKEFPLVKDFCGDAQVAVGGSIWPEDWEVIRNTIFTKADDKVLKWIIAPHEINEEQINRWIGDVPVSCVKYSEATPENVKTAQILWIDNVGMLSSLYRYGNFAFIGGAYKDGLHNILEAAVWGMPVFFGNKKYQKFQEAHDLIALGSAHTITDGTQFKQIMARLSREELASESLKSREYVYSKTGATDLIMQWVQNWANQTAS
ncbi:MAG: glycosyltransferase N-terminal domain-containing protein [Siphonobacter sp.]